MQRLAFYIFCAVMVCLPTQAQMSYWWSQMVRKPDAKTSQEFFFLAGTNVTFTYTNNRVIINGAPGTNTTTLATNAVYAAFATNWLGSNALWLLLQTNAFSTNSSYAVWATNWAQSNSMWISVTNAIFDATNGLTFSQTNIYATNLIGLIPGTNIYFVTNGSGFLEINASNQTVTVLDIRTNDFNYWLGTNFFENDTWIQHKLRVGATNYADVALTTYPMFLELDRTFNGRQLIFTDDFGWTDENNNNPTGAGIMSAFSNVGGDNVLDLGGRVFLGTRISTGSPILFYSQGSLIGGWTQNGALIVGPRYAFINHLFNSTKGGIFSTNFVHTKSYARAENGVVVNSNSWGRLPDFAVAGSSDSFGEGDNWYVCSNWFPFVIAKFPSSLVTTNRLYEAWGFISLTNSVNITITNTATYCPITNFNYGVVKLLTGNILTGEIANTVEGWYKVTLNASLKGPTPGDSMDCDVMVNNVVDERIAAHTSDVSGANKFCNLSASGILHLEIGDTVRIGLSDTTATGAVQVLHAQLSVTRP